MKLTSLLAAAFSVFLLAACGGGGGGKSSSPSTLPDNTPPSVSISGLTEVNSGDIVSLSANATDSDGSIASYVWSTDSNFSIVLSDTGKSQIAFSAPDVDKEATVSVSVVVTDNKGAVTKAVKQVTIKNDKKSLTINGLVLDGGVIPYADVTVIVGDSTFTTKANTSGQYSITLNVSSKNLYTPITITAVGDSTNPAVKLVSQLNSVARLIEQAGTDKTLDAKENLGVNVSNLTTSEYVLLTKPTWWGFVVPLGTDVQLQAALDSLGLNQKIGLATYLHILATDVRFKLPDTYKNSLDFIRDQANSDTFYSQVYAKDPALIASVNSLITGDINLIKAEPNVIGQYILYNQSGPDSYVLTLNADATGELKTTRFKSTVKWNKQASKIILSFPTPVATGMFEYEGQWVIKSAEVVIANSYSNFYLADLILFKSLVDGDGKQIYAGNEFVSVLQYDVSKFINAAAEKMIGEWVTDFGVYQINADKTATFKKHGASAQSTAYTWGIDTNKLVLKANGVTSEEIYFVGDINVGYSYLRVSSGEYLQFRFSQGLLVKPQQNITLKKNDFIGRWLDRGDIVNSTSIRVMATNNTVFTDFGAWPTPWSFNEANNSWDQNFYRQGYTSWLSSCDSAVGTNTDCKLSKSYANKVVAIDGDQYYALRAETTYPSTYETFSVSYTLLQSKKIPEIQYFSQWIMSSTPKTFYQKTLDGIQVWNFYENKLVIATKSLSNMGLFNNVITFSLKNNRIQYVRNNIPLELLLVSASENGLTVCEYKQGANCAAGTEFLLSNRSPAKISLKVEGSGTILAYPASDTASNPAALFGNTATFDVRPDAGSLVKSVTGCGGVFNFNRYTTAEVRDACTITATFSRIPVITLQAGAHGAIEKSRGSDFEYRITPDVGYMVEKVTGCNGVLFDGQYPSYVVNEPPAEDCAITVSFKQKLSVEAKISDPGLASCLDASNEKNIKMLIQLDCQNDVIGSLEGIQNLPSLGVLTLPRVFSSAGITVPETGSLRKLTLGSWSGGANEPTFYLTAIDVSKAKNLTDLIIRSTKITSLDLSTLSNLGAAYIQNNPGLTSLDFSNTKVQALFLARNNLQELKIPAGVVNLFANYNELTNIDLAGGSELTWLDLSNNKISALNLESSSRLQMLQLGGNLLTQVNIQHMKDLRGLQVQSNQLKKLDVSKNVSLETLEAAHNQITDISLINLEKLMYLDLADNQLDKFDLRVSPALTNLKLNKNKFSTLDVSNFAKLVEFLAFDNRLTTIKGIESLDLETYIDLRSNLFDADTLVYLNDFKNVKKYSQLNY